MSKKHKKRKGGEPELSVRRDVKEAAAVQQHWHLTDRPKARKPPEDYKYVEELAHLQFELIKLQEWVRLNGLKVAILFEGRDAAGKGGAIKRITESLNPRVCRVVALGTPTERERGQWYFQRYVAQLPTKGEIVLFDRSWYNRAGVERVMEEPNVPKGLEIAALRGQIAKCDLAGVIYYTGHETIIPSGRRSGMARWREVLFAFMHHNAQRPGAYFKIPSAQIMRESAGQVA